MAPRFERQQQQHQQRTVVAPASSNSKRPLVEHNPRGSPLSNRPKTTGKLPGLNNSMEHGYEMTSSDIMDLIQTMRKLLSETLQGKGPIGGPLIEGTDLGPFMYCQAVTISNSSLKSF